MGRFDLSTFRCLNTSALLRLGSALFRAVSRHFADTRVKGTFRKQCAIAGSQVGRRIVQRLCQQHVPVGAIRPTMAYMRFGQVGASQMAFLACALRPGMQIAFEVRSSKPRTCSSKVSK